MPKVRRTRSWGRVFLAATLLAGVTAGNALYLQVVEPHFDFVAFWSAGRALAQGRSPYDAGVMAALQSPAGYTPDFYSPFYYPPWTGLFFVPLGLLPLSWAAAVWQTLNQVMFLAALWCIAAGLRWRPALPVLVWTAFSGLLFHPTLVALLNGQLAILALFLLSAAYCLIQRGRGNAAWLAVGTLLALMTIKPQLALTTVPALVALLAMRRRWLGIAGFALALGAMAGASELAAPGWMGVWVRDRVDQAATSCAVPSVWGAACDLAPRHWVAVAAAASVALSIGLAILWFRCRRDEQIGWALALTVIVGQLASPFLWVYDQTVLLFAFVVGMACVQSRPTRRIWRAVLFGWAILLPWLLYVWANLRGRATGNVVLTAALGGVLSSLSWGQQNLPGRERRPVRMRQG